MPRRWYEAQPPPDRACDHRNPDDGPRHGDGSAGSSPFFTSPTAATTTGLSRPSTASSRSRRHAGRHHGASIDFSMAMSSEPGCRAELRPGNLPRPRRCQGATHGVLPGPDAAELLRQRNRSLAAVLSDGVEFGGCADAITDLSAAREAGRRHGRHHGRGGPVRYDAVPGAEICDGRHRFRRDHDPHSPKAAQRQIANLPGWKGKKEVIPEAPEFPEGIRYVWAMFAEIVQGVGSNGFGPPLITWESLHAWCELTGEMLQSWEARALVRLGYARAVIEGEKTERESKSRWRSKSKSIPLSGSRKSRSANDLSAVAQGCRTSRPSCGRGSRKATRSTSACWAAYPPRTITVDGRENAALESVNPDGGNVSSSNGN
jgi:hypothetical protein